MTETGSGSRLCFILPSFPVSVNRIYYINHNQRRVSLSNDALLWRTRTAPFVKPCKLDGLLRITLEYESPDWYHKNGKLKRLDVANMEKLLLDTIFLKWGLDDSIIAEKLSYKRYGPREQVKVTVEQATCDLSGMQ